ncbi:sensor histidine kinase [Kibdelosporangium phytohabitans]|uniref:histidine kinase n=1 Tax=Kibdelosporangium phytohabitans TaxID=860235 RepID=A0A0N9I944_9PSEU|nr:HAMP domain-containing sensor histidine kinase [Kibdelosporangium phytohabitans]ALG12917.1 histidine kinase [Kibdelosporangium phytohabitans]MBE1464624.1 two-component system sensor histidine kinase MtrB [Kibdelosporangium phytohabitans]
MRRLTGLRVRLVLAFVLVTVAGAAVAAWASHGSTRGSLVAEAQQRASEDLRRRISTVTAELTYPPDQRALDRLKSVVGGPVLVTYGSLTSAEGAGLDLVTDDMRTAVRDRDDLLLQRVASADGPRLLIGTPIIHTTVDGSRKPSGIAVYAVRDLAPAQQQIDTSARAALTTSALALPVAVLLALLAARGVLRPVRDLGSTARRIASGDLDARLRVRGSDELAELAATFNHMATELQATVAELRRMAADARRFVADVSHELRTPLTTLTAVAEVLESEAERMTPDARESARLAVEETRKLTRLAEDLVEVSRFDAGVATLRLEDVGVRQAIEDCLRARGWRARVGLDAPDEIAAVLDRRRLDVLVANLVGNALKHGQPPVRVRLRADHRRIDVTVIDHGPGLPEGEESKVFERFYKTDAARTRSEGSGLGLAIAMENARLHGGSIEAGNEPRAGARFTVHLPRST